MYNKHTWTPREKITSARLNNMENGIANASDVVFLPYGETVENASELIEAVEAGTVQVIACRNGLYQNLFSYATRVYENDGEKSLVFNTIDVDAITPALLYSGFALTQDGNWSMVTTLQYALTEIL